jgi:nitrate reductase cytochrome c-type subunit
MKRDEVKTRKRLEEIEDHLTDLLKKKKLDVI